MSSDVNADPAADTHTNGAQTNSMSAVEAGAEKSGLEKIEVKEESRSSTPALKIARVQDANGTSGHDKIVKFPTLPTTKTSQPKKKPPRRATIESPNICFECKTTDSKLWRRGPDGQLMCNACGLRWRRSNKPKEAPKSEPRKRKLVHTSSVSPQSPRPMMLPQSSMVAAKKNGLYRHAFGTTANLYGTVPAAHPQNYAHLVYQPQNMFLQQQQQLAQQAQIQQQKMPEASNLADQTKCILNNQNGAEHIVLPATLVPPDDLAEDPSVVQNPTDVIAHGTSLTVSNEGAAEHHLVTSFTGPNHQNGVQDGLQESIANMEHAVTLHDIKKQSLDVLDGVSPDILTHDMTSNDDHHADDFAGLLSLKAYIEDT